LVFHVNQLVGKNDTLFREKSGKMNFAE